MPVRIRRVVETSLYCENLGRASEFYRRLLDTDPMLEGDRLVAFDAGGGTVLLLFQRGGTAAPVVTPDGTIPPHDGSGTTHVAFGIDAADLEWWEARLATLDLAIESRVSWPRGGRSLYFRDPDGHSIELVTPGTWANY